MEQTGLAGSKVAFLAAEGAEQVERALSDAGATPVRLAPDSLDEARASDFSALVVAGGAESAARVASSERAVAFVREFLSYFRAMGYPLLRASDYPRFDAFMEAMSGLGDTDLLDPGRLDAAVVECDAFHGFLTQLFERISRRDELEGVPFDRAAAARALRLYLGD